MVNFSDSYEAEKEARLSNEPIGAKYGGPDLMSLEDKISQSIVQFIHGLGINNEIVERAY